MNGNHLYVGQRLEGYFWAASSSSVTLKATEDIHITDGTIIEYASDPTHSGDFHAYISPNSISVASFAKDGWTVGQFERFEFGVKLPPSLDAEIESFLNNTSNTTLNPYDPDRVSVQATFIDPWGQTKQRAGFYYRDISAPTGSSYIQSKSEYPFRVRIAPEIIGDWYCNVQVFVNGQVIDQMKIAFNVTQSSHRGFLERGNYNKLRDYYGTAFFAIGQDFGPVDHQVPSNCPTGIQPSDLDTYVGHIDNLAMNGGNFIRVPCDKNNFYLEWEQAGVYGANIVTGDNFTRQYRAWALDKVFETCERDGVYMFLINETDQFFQQGGYICNQLGGVEWPNHPYSAMCLGNYWNFFTNSTVFDTYKKRLYYLMARYGYSANLCAIEVCNEISNIGAENGADSPQLSNSLFQQIIYDWSINTANYLKGFYPSPKTTISYPGNYLEDPSFAISPNE